MKREILFRGFHPDENGPQEITLNGQKIRGRWVEGWYCGKTCDTPFSKARESAQILDSELLWYEVIPETVGQEIGLPDKKGKKIFEGDVLSHFINYHGRRINGVVAYDITLAAYMWEPKGLSSLFLTDVLSGNGAEIIGNIHDNPELIEGEVQE